MWENDDAVATIEELIDVEPRLVAWLGGDRPEPDEMPEDEPPLAA
jgi:hypothetical protein